VPSAYPSMAGMATLDATGRRHRVSLSTVEMVPEIRQASTQLPPQTSSPWCSVSPPYGADSMNCPNLMSGWPSEGVGRGHLGGVLYKSIK
jgi:hypothetical protein